MLTFVKHPVKSLGVDNSRQSSLLVAGGVLASLSMGIVTGIFGGLIALLSLLIILIMVVAINDYRAGILLAIILLPLSATSLIPRELFGVTGFNPLNATLFMAAVSILFMYLFHRQEITIPAYPRYFWIYLGMLVLATFHGALHVSSIPAFYKALEIINFDTAAGYVRDIFLKPLLILVTAFMLSIAVRNARRPSIYLIPLFCSVMVLPLAAIGYVLMSGAPLSVLASSESRGTLSVLGMHANELGLMFNMGFVLALFCFFSMRAGLAKWLMGIAAISLMAAVILTFSRGAYLGFLAAIAYFLFVQKKFSVMLLGLLLIPAAILVMPEAVMERAVTGTRSGNLETISAGRVDNIWRPLLPEVFSSPVLGHGLSSILWSEPARFGTILKVGHPHSAYLGMLLDLGLLGAIVVFLFFWHMRRLFLTLAERATEPIWRGFFRGATACILLLLVQGVTDDRFTPTFPQTFLWLAYGMALGLVARPDAAAADSAKRSA